MKSDNKNIKKIKVQIRYRNYKKLHNIYSSLAQSPPENTIYTIPEPIDFLKKLYPLYYHFSDFKIVRRLIKFTQNLFFQEKKSQHNNHDIIHYLHMLPSAIPNTPYIVDIQHPSAIFNFTKAEKKDFTNAITKLTHKNCKRIIFLSKASRDLLLNIYPEHTKTIKSRMELVYPATENFYLKYQDRIDNSLFSKEEQSKFKLLLVGNDPINKGFLEAIAAMDELHKKYPDILLIVVSDSQGINPETVVRPYLKYFPSKFSREELITKLLLISDLFVFPTRGDTFGMAAMEALACGLPVLSTDQFALREVIRHGENGYLLKTTTNYTVDHDLSSRATANKYRTLPADKTLTQELIKYISMLYNDRKLLKRMHKNALIDFGESGKFSTSTRTQKLGTIYQKIVDEK